MNWQWLGRYVLARLLEESTWTGLLKLIVGVTGWSLTQDQSVAIVSAGVALAGVVSILLPNNLNKPHS